MSDTPTHVLVDSLAMPLSRRSRLTIVTALPLSPHHNRVLHVINFRFILIATPPTDAQPSEGPAGPRLSSAIPPRATPPSRTKSKIQSYFVVTTVYTTVTTVAAITTVRFRYPLSPRLAPRTRPTPPLSLLAAKLAETPPSLPSVLGGESTPPAFAPSEPARK